MFNSSRNFSGRDKAVINLGKCMYIRCTIQVYMTASWLNEYYAIKKFKFIIELHTLQSL